MVEAAYNEIREENEQHSIKQEGRKSDRSDAGREKNQRDEDLYKRIDTEDYSIH